MCVDLSTWRVGSNGERKSQNTSKGDRRKTKPSVTTVVNFAPAAVVVALVS